MVTKAKEFSEVRTPQLLSDSISFGYGSAFDGRYREATTRNPNMIRMLYTDTRENGNRNLKFLIEFSTDLYDQGGYKQAWAYRPGLVLDIKVGGASYEVALGTQKKTGDASYDSGVALGNKKELVEIAYACYGDINEMLHKAVLSKPEPSVLNIMQSATLAMMVYYAKQEPSGPSDFKRLASIQGLLLDITVLAAISAFQSKIVGIVPRLSV